MVPIPAHGSIEDGVGAELLAHFAKVGGFAFELIGGGASDDAESGEGGDGVCDFFGKAVGEVFIGRVWAEVLEGEDGEGAKTRWSDRILGQYALLRVP